MARYAIKNMKSLSKKESQDLLARAIIIMNKQNATFLDHLRYVEDIGHLAYSARTLLDAIGYARLSGFAVNVEQLEDSLETILDTMIKYLNEGDFTDEEIEEMEEQDDKNEEFEAPLINDEEPNEDIPDEEYRCPFDLD